MRLMSNQTNDRVVNIQLHALERLSATLDAEGIEHFNHANVDVLLSQKQDWELYHLIGDVMRNPQLALKPSVSLAQKIAHKIDLEPTFSTSSIHKSVKTSSVSRWQRYWPTLAMTAAVVSVAWVARPVVEQMQGSQTAAQFARSHTQSLTASARLQSYVRAHRDLSGPAVVQVMPLVDGTTK
jgi:sigma-E factor negative regulatory protein RseA